MEFLKVGKSYFFRTVTYHVIGCVGRVAGSMVKLDDAAWVADSGRFSAAIASGDLNEVEWVGPWYVNMDTVTDFGEWKHEIPKTK